MTKFLESIIVNMYLIPLKEGAAVGREVVGAREGVIVGASVI